MKDTLAAVEGKSVYAIRKYAREFFDNAPVVSKQTYIKILQWMLNERPLPVMSFEMFDYVYGIQQIIKNPKSFLPVEQAGKVVDIFKTLMREKIHYLSDCLVEEIRIQEDVVCSPPGNRTLFLSPPPLPSGHRRRPSFLPPLRRY